MSTESKFLIVIGIVTLIIVSVGVFFFTKSASQPQQENFSSEEILQNVRHEKGNPEATTTIVEYGDFQCPACGAAHPILKSVFEKNKDKIQIIFKNYPLSTHQNAKIAAQAAEAAAIQGKFWEMHDKLFENQGQWSGSDNPREIFEGYAQEIEIDVEKFKADIETTDKLVEQDFADGNRLGVQSTPTFFINGQKYSGVLQESQLQQIIDGPSDSTETSESQPSE